MSGRCGQPGTESNRRHADFQSSARFDWAPACGVAYVEVLDATSIGGPLWRVTARSGTLIRSGVHFGETPPGVVAALGPLPPVARRRYHAISGVHTALVTGGTRESIAVGVREFTS